MCARSWFVVCLLPLVLGVSRAHAATSTQPVPVTVDNFVRAETDMYFSNEVKRSGIGVLRHTRELMPVDKQTVVRPNRDTVYSSGVFDLDAGTVTITLPQAAPRFCSMMVVNEDHYVVKVVYKAGRHTVTRHEAGTRYVLVGIRTLLDPEKPGDLDTVHALQDGMKVEQVSKGSFDVPAWDPVSQKKVRDALLVLSSTLPDAKGMFGSKSETDPIHHLIGTAFGWGGNPPKDAFYLNVTPPLNDGKTAYTLHVQNVPVDAFWSITVYNAEGALQPNRLNRYSINNLTAIKAADGGVTVRFGDCESNEANCLPITKGWNYTVRLYRPRAEILNGKWKFPDPVPLH